MKKGLKERNTDGGEGMDWVEAKKIFSEQLQLLAERAKNPECTTTELCEVADIISLPFPGQCITPGVDAQGRSRTAPDQSNKRGF